MNLHEYQGKQLFAEYGLPVSRGHAVDSAEEAVEAAESLGGGKWVVKTQVHAGGRGKAGGVTIASSTKEVSDFAFRMLDMCEANEEAKDQTCQVNFQFFPLSNQRSEA